MRSFLQDKELRKYSLQWLAESGKESDLELFKDILANLKSNFEELASACFMVKKWGIIKKKQFILDF